jgi:hypothetical protein
MQGLKNDMVTLNFNLSLKDRQLDEAKESQARAQAALEKEKGDKRQRGD